jgi:hypothetical protein
MDSSKHRWVKHNCSDGEKNNVYMNQGEGFEVMFDNQSIFTFTGLPAAMVMYDNDSGFDGFNYSIDAARLGLSVNGTGDVEIKWYEPMCMAPGDWYEVYFSYERDGFFGTINNDYFPVSPPINYGNNITNHNGIQADNPGMRIYYLVVPYKSGGIRGSSSYSIGIWTEDYLAQYDTIGLPLKLKAEHSADWYCDHINNSVGINYLNQGQQRWEWHSTIMPSGAFDPMVEMTKGYQLSTGDDSYYTYVGE